MIDPGLYLPEATWCARTERLTAAGIPDQVRFATKPALARQKIAAALDAKVPFGWVTGNEVCGADPGLRADLEHRAIGYILAVDCDQRVHANDGRPLIRVYDLADLIPSRKWQLIRRKRTTGTLAFYLCWSTHPVSLHTPVIVAAPVGTSRSCSKPAKARSAWTTTRFAAVPARTASITLAPAVLTILAAQQPDTGPEIIALTVAEIRRLSSSSSP
ncbi:transposase [Micromonospora echinospora]|uniref:transposase n=1 Tax=Micromonospora echinospora TaxID=1877 RepID=UPI0034367BCB